MPEIDKLTTTLTRQVTFSDCDPAKMAYYCRIIEWTDWAHEQLWIEAGYPWHEHFQSDYLAGMPLLDIQVSFRYPMRMGDILTIKSWIEAFEGRTYTAIHEVYNGEHLAARNVEKHAWAVPAPDSPKKIKAVPVPDEVRALFHRPAG